MLAAERAPGVIDGEKTPMITVITKFKLPKPITGEEAMYTDSWRNFVREKYGSDPSVTYFDTPVVVDNLTHEILSDE